MEENAEEKSEEKGHLFSIHPYYEIWKDPDQNATSMMLVDEGNVRTSASLPKTGGKGDVVEQRRRYFLFLFFCNGTLFLFLKSALTISLAV